MKKAIVLHSMVQCMLNRNLCQRVKNYLAQNEISLCDSVEEADLIFFSGCGVLDSNEQEGLEKIKKLEKTVQETNKKQKIILIGCLPKINDKTQGMHLCEKGDYIPNILDKKYVPDIHSQFIRIDNYDYAVMDQLVSAKIPFDEIPHPEKIEAKNGIDQLKYLFQSFQRVPKEKYLKLQKNYLEMISTQAQIAGKGFFYPGLNDYLLVYNYNQITIGMGCKNKCAYCAVRFAKNKVKSIRPEKITAQIKALIEKGERKFVLMSDDMGSWGADIKKSWTELLEEIDKIPCSDIDLALFNLKAEDLLENREVVDKMVNKGKISYICLMSQHVNKRILEYMNRKPFDKENFGSLIEEYGEKGVHIETFTITGFPSETEEEFQELSDFLGSIKTPHFANRTNPFSERYHTPAAQYPDKIANSEKMRRVKEINKVYVSAAVKRFQKLPEDLRELLIKMLNLLNEHEVLYEEITEEMQTRKSSINSL